MQFRKQAYAHPIHHVTVKQLVKLKSGVVESYMILYIRPNDAEKPLLFRELLNYFEMNGGHSLSWQRQVARAVGLFYDFCVEKAPLYKNDNNVTDTLRGFIQCSLSGDAGLGWTPTKAKTVKRYVGFIMEFSRYLELDGTLYESAAKTHKEYFYRAQMMRSNSLLGHVTNVNKVAARLQAASTDHIFKFSKSTDTTNVKVKAFPRELIAPLLNEGFQLENGEENIGAKLLTILMLFGGMRNSEPFHLWFNDFNIYPTTGTLEILLHHPSDSACNIPPYKKKTRYNYLVERRMLPRNNNKNPHSLYAGWKNLALDNDFSTPIRLIHSDAESLFLKLYKTYMQQRQVAMLAYKAKHGNEHPFFFVKMGNTDDIGAPLSMNAYIKYLRAACGRLRKAGYDVTYGAEYGFTPHAMRHWFASVLEEVDTPKKVIQELMNHRSILSQEIYKSSTNESIDSALNKIANTYLLELNGASKNNENK